MFASSYELRNIVINHELIDILERENGQTGPKGLDSVSVYAQRSS
jgi:hypothetical protein